MARFGQWSVINLKLKCTVKSTSLQGKVGNLSGMDIDPSPAQTVNANIYLVSLESGSRPGKLSRRRYKWENSDLVKANVL